MTAAVTATTNASRDTAKVRWSNTKTHRRQPSIELCKILGMKDVRPTRAVVRVLMTFLEDLERPIYGYLLMTETGFSSAKTYQVLARLTAAGWLDRFDDPDASPQSGGPPRITYRLRGDAVPKARRLVNEAREELTPAPARRWVRGTARALGLI